MKEKLLIPISIIIAGFLIALAVILSPAIWKEKSQAEPSKNTAESEKNQNELEKWLEIVEKNFKIPDKNDWINGDLNKARVVFVVYSDLECPFCKRFHMTMKQVMEKYKDQVAWIYRHFPLENLHKKAFDEAVALECVGKIGGNDAFWKYVDKIFEVTPSNDGLDLSLLPKFAKEIGINLLEFNKCYSQKEPQEKIKAHLSEALSIGAQGTPFTLILFDGKKLPLPGYIDFNSLDTQFLSQVLK